MAAPKGNQFWKLRSKHGADAIFTDPKILLDESYKFFQWSDDNPWEKVETKAKPSGEEVNTTPTARPYTISGLCLFLGVNTKYFNDFKKSETYKNNKDFSEVITRIEDIIYTQKFEGAAVGAFNATIMSRELGLADKIQQEHSGEVKTTEASINLVVDGKKFNLKES